MDGELPVPEQASLWAAAPAEDTARTWAVYHLIGDVLRSPELARCPDPVFATRLQQRLSSDAATAPQPPAALPQVDLAPVAPRGEAANASVFRWKLVAGLASVMAVAAVGWASWGLVGGAASGTPTLAAAPAPVPAPAATVTVAEGPEGQQLMIRDPRLDELLAAHRQFGSTTTLQMPAGFLRNATFDSSGR